MAAHTTTLVTMRALVALLLMASPLLATNLAHYDSLCEQMVASAQAAAQHFNQGNQAAADAAIARVEALFAEATALAPDEAQAYATKAVFDLNRNQFDAAMAGFKKALKRTVDPGAQAMLRGRIAHTRYGKYSHARDQAYREGQGNITAAVHWATKQLEVHRHSPVLLHELATMQLMRAAVQPALAAAALELFQQAEDQAAAAWALGAGCARPLSDVLAALPTLAAKPSAVTTHHARAVYGRAATATGAAALDLQYTSDPAFVVELRNAGVAGPDGVVVVGAGSSGCALARSSASPYVSLPSNLQMPATWLPGMAQAPLEHQRWHDAARGRLPNHGALSPAQVKHLTRAASLVHFASTSFYHWLMEGVGRLLLLRSTLENDSRIKVLVPGLESKPFVRETLELLNLKLKAKQLVPYPAVPSPDVVVKAKYLYVADWPAVRHSAEPTHCLTPQPVLQQIRSAFVPNTPLPPAARTKVVFVSRRDVKMRQLADEDALVASLRTRLEALPAFELVVFKGSDHSLADALALFSQAAAIVGAHGGGLANMVAAQPGSLLLEFGFQSPNTRHYAHAAMALDMEYELVLLAADERGAGANIVSVDPQAAEAAFARLATFLESFHLHAPRKDEL